MTTITASDAVQGLLGGLTATTEIRDASGNVLGYYTPAVERERQLYERAKAHFDPEEMKRRAESNAPGYSFEQVMDHLRSLEPTSSN